MKWLLITTNPEPFIPGTNHPHGAGWNVGDVFARIGTEQVIREVDPAATFAFVNMDSEDSIVREQTFDRAVFAGRPMFWRGCETHPLWTHLLEGWLCREPRKVLALGVGDCYPVPVPTTHLIQAIQRAEKKLFALALRRPAGGFSVVCPAAWVLLDRPEIPRRSLVNLMPGGAHYPEMNPAAAALWTSREQEVSDSFRDHGFEFVAHTLQEAQHALELGWTSSRIHVHATAAQYLQTYAETSFYIGNRIHGAIILASRRASASAVGVDSRIYAAAYAGLQSIDLGVHLTTGSSGFMLQNLDQDAKGVRIQFIREERAKAVELLRSFAAQ